MYDLLKLLEENARYTNEELAAMLGKEAGDIAAAIGEFEKKGIICGYKAIVDWDRTEREYVSARIELKVTPQKDNGFEELAGEISRYREVQSLYLMSGGYDLALTVTGKSFKDIASFVAYRLATLDLVQSTATHFVLQKYKEKGVVLDEKGRRDGRVLI